MHKKPLTDIPHTILDSQYGQGSGQVMLTFDDGPNPHGDVTARILDVLKRHNIKASFCLIGKYVDENPALAKRIKDEGHCIVNHTYNHDFRLLKHGISKEIKECDKALIRAFGDASHYYRPPVGVKLPSRSAPINKQTAKLSFYVNEATASPKTHKPLIKDITHHLIEQNGGAIVIHERRAPLTSEPSKDRLTNDPASPYNKSWVPEALDKMITELKTAGLNFTTYDQGFQKALRSPSKKFNR